MNTTMKAALWTGMGMLSLAAIFGGNADAREHGYRYERPVYYPAPVVYTEPVVYAQPAVQREWVEGHYETKCETVMVAPEHKEVRVTPPVLETRRDYFGKPYTVVIVPEKREEICIPAKFEKVEQKIWIPGFYKDMVVQAPVCEPAPAPVVVVPPAPRRGVEVAVGGGDHHRNFFDLFFKF